MHYRNCKFQGQAKPSQLKARAVCSANSFVRAERKEESKSSRPVSVLASARPLCSSELSRIKRVSESSFQSSVFTAIFLLYYITSQSPSHNGYEGKQNSYSLLKTNELQLQLDFDFIVWVKSLGFILYTVIVVVRSREKK